MAIKTEIIKKINAKSDIFVTDTVTKSRRKVYHVDKYNSEIIFFPGKDKRGNNTFFLKKITLEGFKKLPFEFGESGYVKGGVLYYLNKKLNGKGIKKFTISETIQSNYGTKEVVIRAPLKMNFCI